MFHHSLSKIVIANWKMNGTREFTEKFLNELIEREKAANLSNVNIVICPPITLINVAHNIINHNNSAIRLGGQNCSTIEQNGPFTGEISAAMLKDIGCKYVIVGHSETRKIRNDQNMIINRKISAAQTAGIVPILCIGESLEERNNGASAAVITEHITESLTLDIISNPLIIAYEPVWAIGSGVSASVKDINLAYNMIRKSLEKLLPRGENVDNLPIKFIYGGSVNADNAKDILSCEGFDGLLIGGNSLVLSNFWSIVKISDNFVGDL